MSGYYSAITDLHSGIAVSRNSLPRAQVGALDPLTYSSAPAESQRYRNERRSARLGYQTSRTGNFPGRLRGRLCRRAVGWAQLASDRVDTGQATGLKGFVSLHEGGRNQLETFDLARRFIYTQDPRWIVPETDSKELGYRKLRALRPEDIISVHDEAAKVGETWSFEVRDLGSIHYLADRISALGEARYSSSETAAVALHFVVQEHPFWDANHRSGFELAQLILRAFGLRIEAPREEVETFVRSIDISHLPLKDVEHWVKKWTSRLR